MFTVDALIPKSEITAEHRLAVAKHLFKLGLIGQAELETRAKDFAAELTVRIAARGIRRYISLHYAIQNARPLPFSHKLSVP